MAGGPVGQDDGYGTSGQGPGAMGEGYGDQGSGPRGTGPRGKVRWYRDQGTGCREGGWGDLGPGSGCFDLDEVGLPARGKTANGALPQVYRTPVPSTHYPWFMDVIRTPSKNE